LKAVKQILRYLYGTIKFDVNYTLLSSMYETDETKLYNPWPTITFRDNNDNSLGAVILTRVV